MATLMNARMLEKMDEPIGCLRHEPTRVCISVYKKINIFQQWMLRMCFGLRYEKKV